jgi:hypothetical protein
MAGFGFTLSWQGRCCADLAEKEQAFQIMAVAMSKQGFDLCPSRDDHDERADKW